MYDELVKDLRIYANDETDEIRFNAADAIEQLVKDLERSKEWETFWEKEANEALKKFQTTVASMPRWIPVTDEDHIPNTDHGVVGYFGGGAYNQLRWYDFVTILSDGTIVGESTERDVINEHCIAVYKLPEPPKEES